MPGAMVTGWKPVTARLPAGACAAATGKGAGHGVCRPGRSGSAPAMTSGTARAVTARPLVSAVLAGAATGARSFTGLAALTLAAPGGAATQPDRTLARPWAKAVAGALAAQECVLDKVPGAPSRLAPPGLAARLAAAAAAAVIIVRRAAPEPDRPADAGADPEVLAGEPEPGRAAELTACVLVAVGTAAAAAWAGTRWRAWASGQFGRDWVGAGIEDATAVSLGAVAVAACGRPGGS
jgi:uncharacterized membrane protein